MVEIWDSCADVRVDCTFTSSGEIEVIEACTSGVCSTCCWDGMAFGVVGVEFSNCVALDGALDAESTWFELADVDGWG